MNFNNDFKFDLEFGVLNGETWFHELVTNKKVEVKSDRRTQETRNVYIEYWSRGKPSGISTTQADYYVYKIAEDTAFIISTEQLKKRLKELLEQSKARMNVKGGDNNTSLGILCKLTDLIC
jgi:hypothetical protein